MTNIQPNWLSLSGIVFKENIRENTWCFREHYFFLMKRESSKKDLLYTLLPCCFQMLLTEDVILKPQHHLMNGGVAWIFSRMLEKDSIIPSLEHRFWYSLFLEFLLKESTQVPTVEAKIIQIFCNLKTTHPHWIRCPLGNQIQDYTYLLIFSILLFH